MKTITCKIEIEQSQKVVFETTQDYSIRLGWDSYLSKAYLLNHQKRAGLGVESYCENKFGQGMTSKYISYDSPNVAAVTMIKGPWFLEKFSGAWNVKPLGDCRSLVVFTYNYRMKYLPVDRIFGLLVNWVFKSQMIGRLKSLKLYCESNKAVSSI